MAAPPLAQARSPRGALSTAALLLALLALAGALRFHRLGEWPFANDELATTVEAEALLGDPLEPLEPGSQIARLPRLLPVAYALHHLGYELFGRDERGTRVLPALVGTLGVGLVLLLLRKPLGAPAAAVTAGLVALWPEHLFHSQQNRFYVLAWLFGALAMLLGGRALRERSSGWTALACAAAVLAVLCHTVLALLVPTLGLALLAGAAAARGERGGGRWRGLAGPLAVVAATGLLLLLLHRLWLEPLLGGWNAGRDSWRYTTTRSLLAAVHSAGWPVLLWALPGLAIALRRPDGQGAYWVSFAALWALAAALLPALVAYHGHYVFPMCLGVLVLAALFADWAWSALRAQGRPVAAVLALAAPCLANLPSVASHYVDGSRHDYRAAGLHIAASWRPGDRILADSDGLLAHYVPGCGPILNLPEGDSRALLTAQGRLPGRCWIVVSTGRRSLFPPVRNWLDRNARRTLLVSRRRFDYDQFVVSVHLQD